MSSRCGVSDVGSGGCGGVSDEGSGVVAGGGSRDAGVLKTLRHTVDRVEQLVASPLAVL